MSCNTNPSDINQTFIIEPTGAPVVSACTALYTNYIESCEGGSSITLSSGGTIFSSSISGITFNGDTYFSGGTNLITIIQSFVGTFTGNTSGTCVSDFYVTNLYGCSPIVLHSDIIPFVDNTIDLGSISNRFRNIYGVNGIINTLSATTANIGSGGLNVIGDTVIQGNLTVFGPAISAFTSELFIEDHNITLNYNPTGSTTSTSIGAGWIIQDGNGVSNGDVNLDIRAMNGFTGLTPTEIPSIVEYTGATGYSNRAWVTQLNDIVIRSTNTTIPNGVRVIAEFDILDGGFY